MKTFLRIVIGAVAIFLSVGLISTSIDLILGGKDFFSWSPPMGLGVPMLVGGVGLVFNWFGKDDFIYWPF